jgi:hypothetical protein
MGHSILPYETEGCLDVHEIGDLDKTARWIEANGVPRPEFGTDQSL